MGYTNHDVQRDALDRNNGGQINVLIRDRISRIPVYVVTVNQHVKENDENVVNRITNQFSSGKGNAIRVIRITPNTNGIKDGVHRHVPRTH